MRPEKRQLLTAIIDNDRQFSRRLQSILDFYQHEVFGPIHIVGEADSAKQALALIDKARPSLILLDLELTLSSGFEILQKLQKQDGSCRERVLVLSDREESDWISRAMIAGASGYVFKRRVFPQLSEAIDTVLNGDIYMPPEVTNCLIRLLQSREADRRLAVQNLRLTERQLEVLEHLSSGKTNQEIENQLKIEIATVKAHLTEIYTKLGVKSRTQAIVKAIELGLVQRIRNLEPS